MSETLTTAGLNITVLYDPRSATSLLTMKYHYISILTILSQMINFNLDLAVYPAERFGDDYYNMFGQENYVQNCVSFLEPNITEKLAILDCIMQCELCIGLSLCSFIFVKNHHTPDLDLHLNIHSLAISAGFTNIGCIKRVKGDLNLLVKCELKKRAVSARAYKRYLGHWNAFHPNSSNPIILLVNGKKQKTKIMDTGLLPIVCSHLSGEDRTRVCKTYRDRQAIPRIIIDDGTDHIIISSAHYYTGSFVIWYGLLVMVMANI